jgi:hypothetical protein
MNDALENRTFRYLRSIDGKLDRIGNDVRESKDRADAPHERHAGASRRLDSIKPRMERIERRFDLIDFDLIDEHTP